MQLKDKLSTPSFALAVLCLTTLILLTGPAAAGQCSAPHDLSCEVTIPPNAIWWDYFDSVGDTLEFDDDCGMQAPVDDEKAMGGATWVGFDLPAPPHHLSYDFFVKSDPASRNMTGEIVILDMVRAADNELSPVLELRLIADSNELKLVVYGDDGSISVQAGEIAAAGSVINVELTKSLSAETEDATARVRIDDKDWVDLSCFRLWDNLPESVRIGVVGVDSALEIGNLEFQPLGYSFRFFALTK